MLPLLAALPDDSPWEQQNGGAGGVAFLARSGNRRPANYAQVLNAASSFKSLMQEPALRGQVLAGLDDPSPEVERAALRVSLEHFLSNPETAPLVKTAFANLHSSAREHPDRRGGKPQVHAQASGRCGRRRIAGSAVLSGRRMWPIRRRRTFWRTPSCSIRCWPLCATPTPTRAPPRSTFCAR